MRRFGTVAALLGATLVLCGPSLSTQQAPHHEFAVTARRYAFEPATLEVHQGDLIRITLRTQDIPHSFVIDALRIARRATPDHAVTFELFADQAGVFPFYCNLALEDGCRDMRGRLLVRPETGPQDDPAGAVTRRPAVPRNISQSDRLAAPSDRRLLWKYGDYTKGADGIGVALW